MTVEAGLSVAAASDSALVGLRVVELAQGVARLESQLDQASRDASSDQRDVAKKLEDAANAFVKYVGGAGKPLFVAAGIE